MIVVREGGPINEKVQDEELTLRKTSPRGETRVMRKRDSLTIEEDSVRCILLNASLCNFSFFLLCDLNSKYIEEITV